MGATRDGTHGMRVDSNAKLDFFFLYVFTRLIATFFFFLFICLYFRTPIDGQPFLFNRINSFLIGIFRCIMPTNPIIVLFLPRNCTQIYVQNEVFRKQWIYSYEFAMIWRLKTFLRNS